MVKDAAPDAEVKKLLDKMAGRVKGHDNELASDPASDPPITMSISLPTSMIKHLEERKVQNKLNRTGTKTLSGLIREALAKDGY